MNNGRLSHREIMIEKEKHEKISDKLKICIIMLFSLSIFRIFCFQFYAILGDLFTAFLIYCTISKKGRMIAVFCFVNAIIGVIYSIALGSMDISKLDNKSLTNQQIFFNRNSDYKKFNENIFNPEEKSINFTTISIINRQNNQDSKINFNPIEEINSKKEYNRSLSQNFSYVYVLFVTIFSLLSYIISVYFSYKAIIIFKNLFGDNLGEDGNNYIGKEIELNQNYGALDENKTFEKNNKNLKIENTNNSKNF